MSPFRKYNFLLLIILICTLSAARSYGQVKIAPIALYMNDDNKTGRIVVRNTSSEPVEINVDLLFGYPATNSEGKLVLKKFEKAPEGQPSATSWVRIYPRHLVLPPRQQQTIRFAARPPEGLPQGEYWARPAVKVRKTVQGNAASASGQSYKTNINIVQRTILSLNYRHGNVKTGVNINDLSVQAKEDTLYVNAELQRKGNAAYLGHIDIGLVNENGTRKKHHREEIAVYHGQDRKFRMDISGLDPGSYRVKLTLETGERQKENQSILDARPVDKTVTVSVE